MKIITRLPKNTAGRDFIVGDIHGCLNELTTLLEHVNFNHDKDRLFCVGDIGDRGPHSKKTLEFVLSHSSIFPTMGNHDMCIIDVVINDSEYAKDVMTWHGGKWLMDWYRISDESREEAKSLAEKIINKFSLIVSVGGEDGFHVVHSCIPARFCTDEILASNKIEEELNERDLEIILWSRDLNRRVRNPEGKLSPVYCGHTVNIGDPPMVTHGHVNIDTGCYGSYFKRILLDDPRLTMVDHTNKMIYTVSAQTLEIIKKPLKLKEQK